MCTCSIASQRSVLHGEPFAVLPSASGGQLVDPCRLQVCVVMSANACTHDLVAALHMHLDPASVATWPCSAATLLPYKRPDCDMLG